MLPTTGKITLAVEHEHIQAAEELVPAFDKASALGVRHTRIDVLRAALVRGLASLKAEVAL